MGTFHADNVRITEFELYFTNKYGFHEPINDHLVDIVDENLNDFMNALNDLQSDWHLSANLDTLRAWIEHDIETECGENIIDLEVCTRYGDQDPFENWNDDSLLLIDDYDNFTIRCRTEVPVNVSIEKHATIQDAERSNSMNINRIHELDITPNRIWFNPPYTTVEWLDKTKTTACAENPENFSEYNGFAACVAKRLYGNTTQAIYLMDKALDEATRPKREKEARRAAEKAAKREMQEELQKAREYRLKAEVDRERLRRRAVQIVDEEDERRQYE